MHFKHNIESFMGIDKLSELFSRITICKQSNKTDASLNNLLVKKEFKNIGGFDVTTSPSSFSLLLQI